jgi:hypothetical protein
VFGHHLLPGKRTLVSTTVQERCQADVALGQMLFGSCCRCCIVLWSRVVSFGNLHGQPLTVVSSPAKVIVRGGRGAGKHVIALENGAGSGCWFEECVLSLPVVYFRKKGVSFKNQVCLLVSDCVSKARSRGSPSSEWKGLQLDTCDRYAVIPRGPKDFHC